MSTAGRVVTLATSDPIPIVDVDAATADSTDHTWCEAPPPSDTPEMWS